MKLKYLGTAAAEGIPAIWCNCETCQKALKLGGKNIMSRSQSIIDDSLIIDLPPDTYMHMLKEGKTLFDLKNIIITHMHEDHLLPIELNNRQPGFAYGLKYEKVNLYASNYVINFLKKNIASYGVDENRLNKFINFVPMKPYEKYQIDEYTVVPFEATHAFGTEAYFYLISKDNKNILYGNDTGIFTEKVDEYLSKNKIHIDILSLDCTKGDYEASYNIHMSMKECQQIVDRFTKLNIIDKTTKKVFTHFSHNCQMVYEELVEAAKKYDFEVAFDGFEISC